MPQGDVVQGVVKKISRDPGEGAHVEFPDPVSLGGVSPRDKEMSQGHQGDFGGFAPPGLRQGGDLGVVIPETFDELPLLVLGSFSRFGGAEVSISQIGDGADEQFGVPLGIPEGQHFVFAALRRSPHYVDRQRAQEVLGSVEERRGVVVASHEDRVAAGGVSHPRKKAVVELLGPVAGNTGVEEVPRYQEHVDFLPGDGVSEPVQKGREFVVPFSAVQRAADVPVRGVEQTQIFG